MEMNKKAIALLSGGLDSSLAVRMMLDQGIEITAVNFNSPFCNCTPKKAGCKHQARKVAEEFGVPIRVIAKGMDYMRMVQNPPHGHGRGMNPCVDCRIYMLRKVREMMPGEGASFVVTGEVLGQRPMSQRRRTLDVIEQESGLEGLILRPLSARNLPPTEPERAGVVDREKLLAISGRSRKTQIMLAEELGVKDYPCPAGGCLLTDEVIAARLKDLFAHVPDYGMLDLQYLKIGRHFRLRPGLKFVVGRDREENESIEALAPAGAALFIPEDFSGPTAIAFGLPEPSEESLIGAVIAGYCREKRDVYFVRRRMRGGDESVLTVREPIAREKADAWRVGNAARPSAERIREGVNHS